MPGFAQRVYNMEKTAEIINGVFKGMTSPDIISFGGGSPANELLPVDIVRSIAETALRRGSRGTEALQYGKPQGLPDLKQAIADKLMAPMGLDCDADQLIITSGGMEAIYLVCQLYLEPGDVILVESPTFVHAVECFDMLQAKCIAVEMDEKGMILQDLEDKVKKYKPKMIYTIPTFQNPSGRTLSQERRKKLAQIGSEYDVIILEDDPYRNLRYSGKDLSTVKEFDETGNTIFINSFSKIFAPGARLGYAYGAPNVIAGMVNIKTATNSFTSTMAQVVGAEYLKGGHYDAHLPGIISLYRDRRDVMLQCIDRYFPEGTRHTYPDGGLYTWVQLPEHINVTKLLPVAAEHNLAYISGEGFFTEGGGKGSNCMRMCFSNVSEEKIRVGVERLGNLLKNY